MTLALVVTYRGRQTEKTFANNQTSLLGIDALPAMYPDLNAEPQK